MESALHRERVTAVAGRYRQRGYQVVEEPVTEQLPSFLQELNFRPDLLAENGSESVIVEIQSFGQVARSRKMEKVAKSVERHPNWRLELVLNNPPESIDPMQPAGEPGSATIGFSEIEERIGSSKHLASVGDLQAAVILLWSALEATIRSGLERIPASFINNAPSAILKQGVAYGLMDPEDYDTLNQLLPVRNAAVHGFAEAVDVALLEKSTRITKSILVEAKTLA
jgi:hypothetical protein